MSSVATPSRVLEISLSEIVRDVIHSEESVDKLCKLIRNMYDQRTYYKQRLQTLNSSIAAEFVKLIYRKNKNVSLDRKKAYSLAGSVLKSVLRLRKNLAKPSPTLLKRYHVKSSSDKFDCARFLQDQKPFNDADFNWLTAEDVLFHALGYLDPALTASEMFANQNEYFEKLIGSEAENLPIWRAWIKDLRGITNAGLGLLVGATGNVNSFSTPYKLNKWLGLAVRDDGIAQSRRTKGCTIDYRIQRRVTVWNVGTNFIRSGSPYKKYYDDRRLKTEGKFKSGKHAHLDAHRVMEQKFIRDFWRIWHRCTPGGNPNIF